MTYTALPGLMPKDFEHPGEKAAMAVLRKIPVIDTLLAKYVDFYTKTGLLAQTAGGYYRITEKTNPRIYGLYRLALTRLDMPKEYPLYCMLGYDYNAFAAGAEDQFIVINSSTVVNYSDGEMLHLLGHELGHIKCGHVRYHTLARSLNMCLSTLGDLGAAVSTGVQYAILNWERMAEYSADRAGLIAAGDIAEVESHVMKLLGQSSNIPYIDFDADKVIQQVDEFQMDISDPIGQFLYVAYTLNSTHPWTILRLKQIRDWHNSGEYESIIKKYNVG